MAADPYAAFERDLKELEDMAGYRSAADFRQARRLNFLTTILGVSATLLASVAAITVLPDNINRWATAVTAFAAAVISGLTTTFRPDQAARRKYDTGTRWLRLADDARRAWSRELPHLLNEHAAERLEDILQELLDRRDNLIRSEAGLDADRTPARAVAAG